MLSGELMWLDLSPVFILFLSMFLILCGIVLLLIGLSYYLFVTG